MEQFKKKIVTISLGRLRFSNARRFDGDSNFGLQPKEKKKESALFYSILTLSDDAVDLEILRANLKGNSNFNGTINHSSR